MDKVSECGNLYISGLDVLDDPECLTQAGITHILSVLEFDYCDYPEFEKYTRILIQAEDHPLQDLTRHFQLTNDFIESALAAGAGQTAVLVHCAMRQSRSATIVCAYMMYSLRITADRALELLRSSRPMCAPNEGFMAQLLQYEKFLGVEKTPVAISKAVVECRDEGVITQISFDAPEEAGSGANAAARCDQSNAS